MMMMMIAKHKMTVDVDYFQDLNGIRRAVT